MDKIRVSSGLLKGDIIPPASKSYAHRALLCAMLSGKPCIIENVDMSVDIETTMNCVKELGSDCVYSESERKIQVGARKEFDYSKIYNFNCKESGSTLRFILPIISVLGLSAFVSGEGRLPSRPLDMFADIFINQPNVIFKATNDKLPVSISGKLQAGIFEVNGEVSSQHLSGLLMALPLLEEDSTIVLKTPLESAAYVAITIDVMKQFGVTVEITKTGYKVKGGQQYLAQNFIVEADYSQAAFWLVAGCFSGELSVAGLNPNSAQGDKAMVRLLEQFGAEVAFLENKYVPSREFPLIRNRIIDVSQIPDLVPILAVISALTPGKTIITNAARLRMKESDRLRAISDGLTKMGALIIEKEDGLEINGKTEFRGSCELDSYNDHRIVMALAIAALKAKYPIIIKDYKCINKSYPNFFEHFKKLGGHVDEL